MGSEWNSKKIGTLGHVVTGKTPSTKDTDNFGGPYPFITIPDLDGRVLIDKTERTISERGAAKMRTCLLPANSVMTSCIATIGKCGITTRPSFTNQQINSVICDKDVEPRFLYYAFTQLSHALEAAGGGGSVYTNISKSRFSDIEVSLPGLAEQRAIAHILGTLDDKIELNRKINETLEQMAQALFKSWFVDFDSVRAKAEGRKPAGMTEELAALFPDSFQNSELGKIPKGWRITSLGNLLEFVKGKKPAKTVNSPGDGLYPVILIETFAAGSSMYAPSEGTVQAVSDDILMVMDGASSGRVETGCKGVVGSTIAKLIPKQTSPGKRFLYYFLKHIEPETREHLTGTSIPHADKGWIFQQNVCIPDGSGILEKFEVFSNVLRKRITLNITESRTLVAIRDTLLPKLLSGEIRVKDTEKFVEEQIVKRCTVEK